MRLVPITSQVQAPQGKRPGFFPQQLHGRLAVPLLTSCSSCSDSRFDLEAVTVHLRNPPNDDAIPPIPIATLGEDARRILDVDRFRGILVDAADECLDENRRTASVARPGHERPLLLQGITLPTKPFIPRTQHAQHRERCHPARRGKPRLHVPAPDSPTRGGSAGAPGRRSSCARSGG